MEIGSISRRHVRELLRHLSRDRTPGRTPLAQLECVRRSLEQSGFEPSHAARQFEVGRLVSKVVEEELCRLRRRLEIEERAPSRDEYSSLAEDFSWANRELEAWSAVYYLYLRPDLDLSLNDVVALLHDRHRRTIQRRLRRGIRALTFRLQELEYEAVLEARRERAMAALPLPSSREIVGAESLLAALTELLMESAGVMAVGIGGPGGIGKSELALRAARAMAESGALSAAHWIAWEDLLLADSEQIPGGYSEALNALSNRVSSWGLGRDQTGRALVVVDGLDEVEVVPQILETLLPLASGCAIALTGRVGWSRFENVREFLVPPLSVPSSRILVRSEARSRGLIEISEASDAELEPLVQATCGNPLAVHLAVSSLRLADTDHVVGDFTSGSGPAEQLTRRLWAPVWDRATSEVKAVVLTAVSLLRKDEVPSITEIMAECPLRPSEANAALQHAVDSGLLVSEGDAAVRCLRPASFLDAYLRSARA